jgi:hypothetical protein
MPTEKKPGLAYEDMYDLIETAKPSSASMIGNEILIAIFWEESFFNNIEQIGGTAWGFGQVEPAEMYWLETDEAKQYGYYVAGLPRRMVLARDEKGRAIKTRLCGQLKPEQSVQVAAAVLCHYYHAVNPSVRAALYAYAGVGYKGKDVPAHLATGSARARIVHDWLECEAYLKKEWKPDMFTPPDKKKPPPKPGLPHSYEAEYPKFIKAALQKARRFDVENKDFDDILFPKNYLTETGQKIWRPQRTPKWLTELAKSGWR